MKLEETKRQQNVFDSSLNEMSRERYKSEEQKNALENIKLVFESWLNAKDFMEKEF